MSRQAGRIPVGSYLVDNISPPLTGGVSYVRDLG